MKKILIISVVVGLFVFLLTYYLGYKDLVSHQPVFDANGTIVNKDFTSNPPQYALVTAIPAGIICFVILFGLLCFFKNKKININMKSKDYKGMTINERLYECGLFDDFDKAYKNGNIERMTQILKEVSIDEDSIVEILKIPYNNYNSKI